MTLQEIKEAVDNGKRVCLGNSRYPVIKDDIGQYMIGCDVESRKPYYIGLTWQDGVTLNGREEDFYIKEG